MHAIINFWCVNYIHVDIILGDSIPAASTLAELCNELLYHDISSFHIMNLVSFTKSCVHKVKLHVGGTLHVR